MQPLPAGPFPEEVAEEAPAQPESEPKVLDPEEDLLCIAKTFSYLRESGESGAGRLFPGSAESGSLALTEADWERQSPAQESLVGEVQPSRGKHERGDRVLPWFGAPRSL